MSFYRVTKEPERRVIWLKVLKLSRKGIKPSICIGSGQFPDGIVKKNPSLSLGKRFATSVKQRPRAQRAKDRDEQRQLRESSMIGFSECTRRSVTPASPNS